MQLKQIECQTLFQGIGRQSENKFLKTVTGLEELAILEEY